MVKYPYPGIILAGGLNRRMAGLNKALLSVGGRSIIERQLGLFKTVFNRVILVTNQPLDFASWDVTIVTDLLPVRSSLSGVHAGLFYTRTSHAFIAAGDMPFIKPEMIELLMEELDLKKDIIVPVTKEGYQPLCAVYSKRCLQLIEEQYKKGEMKISKLFSKVRIKTISEVILRSVDPELVSFFNINTEKDLTQSRKLIAHG
jgi:molybdenum cofactor guanylyltransferase